MKTALALAGACVLALTGPSVAAAGIPGTHSFRSEPWLHPPIVSMTGRDPDPQASGDIFADAQNSALAGPVILSPSGRLVWFDQLPDQMYAYDVQVQSYDGQSVITFWQGRGSGFGAGYDVVLNHYYHQIATVRAGGGDQTDSHEFEITPNGHALITARALVHTDLSPVGGPRHGLLRDNLIQEIDIATGQVIWRWDAYHHVHLTESYAGKPTKEPYDFFHINSVQELANGNLLVSARHTWAVYEISKQTGRIVWVLGGKHSSFKLGRGANFEWQHDAHRQPDGTITLFDDAAGLTANESQSRALRLRLDFKRKRAMLVRSYTNNPPLLSLSQGSMQVLADGDTFVGWGYQPYFTEFGRTGRQLFSLHFPAPVESYRGYRFQWWGQPTTPPSVAAVATHTGMRVYASWNGATDVASWRVLAGPSPTELNPVGQFARNNFESKASIAETQPYLAVQALNGSGAVLATSATISR